MSAHSSASLGARHPVHNWEFTDASVRAAYVPVTADIGKIAYQLDDKTFWVLKTQSPAAWNSIDGGVGGGGGAASMDVGDEVQRSMVGVSEELLAEFTVDFASLTPSLLYPKLSALTKQTGGATGTYRMRVGGTQGVADGTVVATITTTQAAYPVTPDVVTGASYGNPAAPRLVKITGAASSVGQTARIKGINILFVST